MRALVLCCAMLAAQSLQLHAEDDAPAPLALLDVPFISQSEALCGGAAAAMVLRYWGERGLSAEDFRHLVDGTAAGIRTDALIADLRRRGWIANGIEGDESRLRAELSRARPVLTLIEDRPSTFHYLVVLAWHERGVVFHDPARAPFRVMSTGEFTRRWRAASRWMAVVVPGETPARIGPVLSNPPGHVETDPAAETGGRSPGETNACARAVAEGVRLAQSNDLEGAERVLAAAIACPGAAAELAGVRVLQKRWPEASDLAAAAVAADARDGYAWKVLATSRFVQNDRLGALAAWNRGGEPRLDLVRIDGLTRTRYRPVERLLGAKAGTLLTAGSFTRAKRRLAELPSASSTRLEYVPVPSGLAELRASVAERPLVPTDRLSLVAAGLATAVTREVRLTTGSLVGGGEQVAAAWRFWPHRPRVAAGIRAPAPWGGIWALDAFSEWQPFTAPVLPESDRVGGRLDISDWMTARLRWSVNAGVEEWASEGTRVSIGGSTRWLAVDDRLDAAAGVTGWLGRAPFARFEAGIRVQSAPPEPPAPRPGLWGLVFRGTANAQIASDAAPLDLWGAGDTGLARATLLRAHPVLEHGRLRVDRLGRFIAHGSLEVQRWWTVRGPVRAAAAAFGDSVRTARRRDGPACTDFDVGVGSRLAILGVPGVFRVDVAKGLRDGATAVSFAYEP